MKNVVIAYLCYKEITFRNMSSDWQRTISGWLTMIYFFFVKEQNSRWPRCINYNAKHDTSSPITMQIISVIYGFVCLEGRGIKIHQGTQCVPRNTGTEQIYHITIRNLGIAFGPKSTRWSWKKKYFDGLSSL